MSSPSIPLSYNAILLNDQQVKGPSTLSTTTINAEGIAVTGRLNTTHDIWCAGQIRARNDVIVDGSLLVGAGSGQLYINGLANTRSFTARRDATMKGTTHCVGTTTFGASRLAGLAQNVVPPGVPTTPEIKGKTQFLNGHNGEFSTLQGYWDERRGTQLNNNLTVLLGVSSMYTGQMVLEGGIGQPFIGTHGTAAPLKGSYNLVSK